MSLASLVHLFYMLLWYLCNANEVKNLQHMTTQQPHVGKLLALAIKFLTSIHHCNLVRNPSMTFFIATSIARFWSAPVRIVWGAAPPITNQHAGKYYALKMIVHSNKQTKWHVIQVGSIRCIKGDNISKEVYWSLLFPLAHIKLLIHPSLSA